MGMIIAPPTAAAAAAFAKAFGAVYNPSAIDTFAGPEFYSAVMWKYHGRDSAGQAIADANSGVFDPPSGNFGNKYARYVYIDVWKKATNSPGWE